MNKNKLRKLFLQKRQAFIPFKKGADKQIFQKFINLPVVKKSKTICFYVSKEDEVDTGELIKYYLTTASGSDPKHVVVPKVVGKNLELYEIKSFSDLSPGKFGILEPKVSSRTTSDHLGGGAPAQRSLGEVGKRLLRGERLKQVDKNDVDLFVVPGIVFSKSGQRLGFGKGYYDRLLKNTRAFKLGLAYSWQIVDKLPEEKGDILMDLVLTEESTHFIPRCVG